VASIASVASVEETADDGGSVGKAAAALPRDKGKGATATVDSYAESFEEEEEVAEVGGVGGVGGSLDEPLAEVEED